MCVPGTLRRRFDTEHSPLCGIRWDRWSEMARNYLGLLLLFLPGLGPTPVPQGQHFVPELPHLIKKALDEFLTRKYLHAFVDAFLFASSHQPWSPMDAQRYLMHRNGSLSIEMITSILTDYRNSLIRDPQLLVSELSSLDFLQFTTMLRLLFSGRKEQILVIEVDFEPMKVSLESSPGGNRSLFAVAREKCMPALREGHCVDLMGVLLSLSDGEFVHEDFIRDVPTDLSDDIFRNLSAVFKDLYDMFSVTTQRAIYEWIILGLQKTYKSGYSPSTWMTAENLWFLGRYMVHLTVQSIRKISLSEMRIFIHYDNATKQLDSVYDIKPGCGKAFLHRVNASGFDMTNVSIAYRLGLLVCFYDNVQLLDATDARSLLHQLIKCNQLRGSLTEVQKLKSQLLAVVMRNQSLNESLGSVSDAVVGLTPSQLQSLSAQAVQSSMAVLQQVSGWTRSQTIILVQKYMGTSKVLTLSNIHELGSLISGLDANLFYSVSTEELARAMEGDLVQYATHLNPTQQHAIINQMLTAVDAEGVAPSIPGLLFSQVSLSSLVRLPSLESLALEEKQLTQSQASFLFEFLSKSTPVTDLIRTGQLLKGIRCDKIQRMDGSFLAENFPIFQKNFHLLSPFQRNCLAWRYWETLDTPNSTIPPLLLSVLPLEFVENMPATSCKGFLVALGQVDLDLLIVNDLKREAVIEKALQCLSEGIRDEYVVDVLGTLLCHLPPAAIRDHLSLAALPATLQQLRGCARLAAEQRAALRSKLLQLYGPPREWTAELTQDLGALVTLLSREEILVLANTHPEEILPLVLQAGRPPLTEDFLAAIFEVVREGGPRDWFSSGSDADCGLIKAPSTGEIQKLSEANVYWSPEELQCISNDTFTETVELLGSVRGYNLTQLRALKSRAEQTWGPLSTWKNYNVISLGSIALALTEEDINMLDLSSIDTMTALSQQSKWTPLQMNSLLYRFLESSGLSVGELRGSDLAGLGILLCGVEPSQINLIDPEAYSTTAAWIGTLPCPLPVLQQLKGVAEKVFGPAGTWNCSVLLEVGVVAAGMSTEEIRELRPDLMPYLQPQAIAAIPAESFKELSKDQLKSLGPENAVAVTSSQCAQLSDKQLTSLQTARDGLREGLASHMYQDVTGSLGAGTISSGVHLRLSCGLLFLTLCTSFPEEWQ